MRVFVVDDDPQICELICRVVERDGHVCVKAERGAEALQRALAEDFDVLLCDLMLPDLNGTEVIRAIKAQSPDLPVIVISALAPDEWKERCYDAGATGYLQKPMHVEDLRAELRLVAAGRPDLSVWLVDPDDIHRVRIRRELSGQGCAVETWPSAAAALHDDGASPNLLLIDAGLDGAADLIRRASANGAAALVFGETIAADREEALLRAGAAMCLGKPIDTGALLIQARFLTQA